MKKILIVILVSVTLIGCKQKATDADIAKFCKTRFSEWNRKLTYVIMTDIFSPPVCSRIYVYPNIAAYEALLPENKIYKTYAGKLNGLAPLPQPQAGEKICYSLSASIAFTTVAAKLVFNGDAIVAQETEYLHELDSMGISKELLESSVSYGRKVGNHIVEWSKKDGYKERTALGGYIVKKDDSTRWIPTPPDYIDAVENNWSRIRTLVLDSASRFRPGPPIPYSTKKESLFYKESMRVYNAVSTPNPGDSATAFYWDDNPNTSVTDGHITYFIQKNSPPGHWIHISCSIADKENYDEIKTASLLSKTAIALFDGFIACWEAKYYYNYLRPETFINKNIDKAPQTFINEHIDKTWEPLLQSPAFPEYPSGHSTISASAATVLTRVVGSSYSFIDSTEVPYGRPERKFTSFYDASDQANISRLYAGIHFLPSLNTGAKMGREVGNYIMDKLK